MICRENNPAHFGLFNERYVKPSIIHIPVNSKSDILNPESTRCKDIMKITN